MIQPEESPVEERALQPRPEPTSMPAPLAAMAEALRANAEALRRLDASQHRIAETIERSDRAQEVVASTRALNETFRGLSEIQRGLLDAVVKTRRGAGSPLLFVFAALLAAILSVLLYDRWVASRTVPIRRFEEARAEAATLREGVEELKDRLAAGAAQEREGRERLAERDEALAAAAGRAEEQAGKMRDLERELREKEARLDQFLAVKAQADLAGALQIQNAGLEREIRDLREKVSGLERERANALEVFGDKLMDLRGVDPEELKAVARGMGIYAGDAPAPVPGSVTLSRSGERLLTGQVNRLLPDAEESYDIVHVAAVDGGSRLVDVTLTRNRDRQLVHTLKCKEMVVHVDPEADTVELRLRDGVITNPARPGEEIPIAAEGHSVFLPAAGVKEWLRREEGRVEVGPEGRVSWKIAVSATEG
jgi:hypothetical protein